MQVRPAAVAGSFYPGSKTELEQTVQVLLDQAPEYLGSKPQVLVVPHAGYVYSGLTAAYAYNSLKRFHHYQRVVLLGPAHRVAFHGMALPTSTAFQTPLGDIALDRDTIRQLSTLPDVHYLDQAHSLEHSLEVQLPFLQQLLPTARLIPIVVGETVADSVENLINAVWSPDTLIIISTDLSHFHPYTEAQQLDKASIHGILSYTSNLQGEQACGCRPLNGLLKAAQKKALNIELLDYRNSGDSAGSKDSVVGYAAFSLFQ